MVCRIEAGSRSVPSYFLDKFLHRFGVGLFSGLWLVRMTVLDTFGHSGTDVLKDMQQDEHNSSDRIDP